MVVFSLFNLIYVTAPLVEQQQPWIKWPCPNMTACAHIFERASVFDVPFTVSTTLKSNLWKGYAHGIRSTLPRAVALKALFEPSEAGS